MRRFDVVVEARTKGLDGCDTRLVRADVAAKDGQAAIDKVLRFLDRGAGPWPVLTGYEAMSPCLACVIEADIGGPDDPHPVPAEYHTCASPEARAAIQGRLRAEDRARGYAKAHLARALTWIEQHVNEASTSDGRVHGSSTMLRGVALVARALAETAR